MTDKKEVNPLTLPIARSGELIYATIMRNRSGMDSGQIDMGVRVFDIQELPEWDKQAICDTAFAMYKTICRNTNKKATNDREGLGDVKISVISPSDSKDRFA